MSEVDVSDRAQVLRCACIARRYCEAEQAASAAQHAELVICSSARGGASDPGGSMMPRIAFDPPPPSNWEAKDQTAADNRRWPFGNR